MPSNSAFNVEGAYGAVSTAKQHLRHRLTSLSSKGHVKKQERGVFSVARWFLDGVFVWSVSRQREAVCKDS